MDNVIAIDVQQRNDGARCKALTASLADACFEAIGERGEGEELILLKEMIGWSTAKKILGL